MRITEAQYREAYRCARWVHDEPKRMRVTDAKKHLEKVGLNPNSALDFVYIFRHMLRGEIYKRAMSEEATEDFILWIRRDYGEIAFQNALSALRKHIPYKGGKMIGHVSILEKHQVKDSRDEARNAADDLDESPIGNERPDRAKRISNFIVRDEKVRAHALRRSKGRCEYCGSLGFLLPSGKRYVEAHHIIALAASGRDTPSNVIALCPSHHREAHYGSDAEKLESDFVIRLSQIEK